MYVWVPDSVFFLFTLGQGCPVLYLDICQPLGFHSNPNKVHLIQQPEISLCC